MCNNEGWVWFNPCSTVDHWYTCTLKVVPSYRVYFCQKIKKAPGKINKKNKNVSRTGLVQAPGKKAAPARLFPPWRLKVSTALFCSYLCHELVWCGEWPGTRVRYLLQFLSDPSPIIALPFPSLSQSSLWNLTDVTLECEDANLFSLMLNWIVGFVKAVTTIFDSCYMCKS